MIQKYKIILVQFITIYFNIHPTLGSDSDHVENP